MLDSMAADDKEEGLFYLDSGKSKQLPLSGARKSSCLLATEMPQPRISKARMMSVAALWLPGASQIHLRREFPQ
jgi:hypothetical protein